MPRSMTSVKRLFLVIFCIVAGYLFFSIFIPGKNTSKYRRKYKLRHNYSFLQDPHSHRLDLSPKLVYRGTRKEIDPNDIGLVKSVEDKELREAGYQHFAYNTLVSQRIGFSRQLPDTRHKLCKSQKYSPNLPSASIIICFYNEDLTTLLRTLHSVVNNTPSHLLHELILINDHSDGDISDRVGQHIHTTPSLAKVRLESPGERLGLIRARVFGARKATGEVLVFLDSHIETNLDWIQPLLHQVQADRTHVVTPIIDIINPDTFKYTPSPLVRGGFNWGLHFKWESLPEGLLKSEPDFVSPILSPTMAGGLFAIDRNYFVELGEYDTGLDIWGGENLEISFRIWMCGGRLDIIPCSRVGHVFRKRRPYTSSSAAGVDTQTRNAVRVGKVWLGEKYFKYFIQTVPGAETINHGDLTARIQLREKLHCKNFTWYLTNIYPELKIPGQEENVKLAGKAEKVVKYQRWDQKTRNYTRAFQIKHLMSGQCLESQEAVTVKTSRVKLATCLRSKRQSWYQTDRQELVLSQLLCLDSAKSAVRMMKCHEMGGEQEWTVMEKGKETTIYNMAAGMCLKEDRGYVDLGMCQEKQSAVWKIIDLL